MEPFTNPRNHDEEIANARHFEDAIRTAHIREVKEARDTLGVVLIVFASAALSCIAIGVAVAKYLAIN